MDTTPIEDALEELTDADPAQAPELADAVANRLESELEAAGAPSGVPDDGAGEVGAEA